jgi:hypothetical protein
MDQPIQVESRADLAFFVESMVDDLKKHPEQWENTTLQDYLEALARYLHDLPGWCKNVEPSTNPETAQWSLFAVALSGAQIYE